MGYCLFRLVDFEIWLCKYTRTYMTHDRKHTCCNESPVQSLWIFKSVNAIVPMHLVALQFKLRRSTLTVSIFLSLSYFETPHNPSTLQHLFITTHFYTFRSVYMHFCVNYKTSYRKTTKKKTKRIVRRSRINLLKIVADNFISFH